MAINKFLFLFVAFFCVALSQNVNAELFNSKKKQETPVTPPVVSEEKIDISAVTANHMVNMAKYCVGNWENEACIKELSSLSMDTTTNYAEALDAGNKKSAMEDLKQNCAAATAALKISVPAYAMKSAITQCVNSIYDINNTTLIKPDLNLYQLLVGSVMCLGKDIACENIEASLLSIQLQSK